MAKAEKRCIVKSRGIISSTAMAIMKEMTMQMHCIVMTAVDLAEFEDSVVIVAVGAIVVVVEVEDTIAEED